MRVLIVDDSIVSRLALRKVVEKLGYQHEVRTNGKEAWELLRQQHFDVVLADWLMPEMDGIALCKCIRSADFEEYIYIILCTGKNEHSDFIEAMNAGADDFITKPIRLDEATVRLRSAARISDLQQKLREKNELLQKEHAKLAQAYDRIEDDLVAASKDLESLLPEKAPGDFPVLATYRFRPSHFLGGDFLNYFKLGKNFIGVYVLDVSGHGVSAALRASSVRRILMPSADLLLDPITGLPTAPDKVASDLNRRFYDNGDYFTLIYGVLDLTTLMFCYVQAGHPSPVLLRNGLVSAPGEGGYPLALLEGVDYEEQFIQLQIGDRLFLYSDGVTEAESKGQVFYGEERLNESLTKSSILLLEDALDRTVGDISHFCNDVFLDDMSLFALEIP